MLENQSNIDHEATDFQDDLDLDNDNLSEEDYLIQTINSVSEVILSDDYYNRNEFLIKDMCNGFRDRHIRRGDMPPSLAGRSLEIFFSSITKFGLR